MIKASQAIGGLVDAAVQTCLFLQNNLPREFRFWIRNFVPIAARGGLFLVHDEENTLRGVALALPVPKIVFDEGREPTLEDADNEGDVLWPYLFATRRDRRNMKEFMAVTQEALRAAHARWPHLQAWAYNRAHRGDFRVRLKALPAQI